MAPHASPAVRRSLEDAVAQFLATGSAIGPQMWERPATDRWTVRQLFAHVVRGMAVLSEYLDADLEPTGPRLTDAADYFRTALSADGSHDGIAARAEAAATGAPDDLTAWGRQISSAMLDRVAATADDRILVHFAGPIRFDDYLVTRLAELVLHTFDLQLACGLAVDAPPSALAVVNPLLLTLADRADPRALALALTGRTGPVVCNVLG
jgi:uncharacterized protein (TIGR03083 family)